MKLKYLLALWIVLFSMLLISPAFCEQKPTVVKIAVIMPEGSKWTNTLHEMVDEVETLSENRLQFKVYPGAVSGDEEDVIRKMTVGILQAAGFTGTGLSILQPRVRILECPNFFHTFAEYDYVKKNLYNDFYEGYEKKGYTFLGFFDAGFVHFFSKKNIADIKSLQSSKMWVWTLDKISKTNLKEMNVNAVPLPITDVITGLETDMIDSFYAPLLAAVAMQWHSRVSYIVDLPLGISIGGMLMKKNVFDSLSPEDQATIRTVTRKYCQKLSDITRNDNVEAKKIMENMGFTFIKPTPELVELIRSSSDRANKKLIGELYDQAFYDKAVQLRNAYRADQKTKGHE